MSLNNDSSLHLRQNICALFKIHRESLSSAQQAHFFYLYLNLLTQTKEEQEDENFSQLLISQNTKKEVLVQIKKTSKKLPINFNNIFKLVEKKMI